MVRWYQTNKRDLPWRDSLDPYAVWISEIMLQQTRVEAVTGYYLRFLKRFPDIQTLAEADEEEVLKYWEGLGYYSRARNLKRAAQVIMKNWNGRFPSDYESVRALPGVGDYTAGAICSIAFGKAYPAVDGNVLRVIARLYALEEDVLTAPARRKITQIVQKQIPAGQAGEFTQSLMELGAMVCIPNHPRCDICPVQGECQGYEKGIASSLPLKKKKPEPETVHRYVLIVRQGDRVLLSRRQKQGVLAGLLEFPGVDRTESSWETWKKTFKLNTTEPLPCFEYEHDFSHIRWLIEVWLADALQSEEAFQKEGPLRIEKTLQNEGPLQNETDENGPETFWVDINDLDTVMLPAAFRRIVLYL